MIEKYVIVGGRAIKYDRVVVRELEELKRMLSDKKTDVREIIDVVNKRGIIKIDCRSLLCEKVFFEFSISVNIRNALFTVVSKKVEFEIDEFRNENIKKTLLRAIVYG